MIIIVILIYLVLLFMFSVWKPNRPTRVSRYKDEKGNIFYNSMELSHSCPNNTVFVDKKNKAELGNDITESLSNVFFKRKTNGSLRIKNLVLKNYGKIKRVIIPSAEVSYTVGQGDVARFERSIEREPSGVNGADECLYPRIEHLHQLAYDINHHGIAFHVIENTEFSYNYCENRLYILKNNDSKGVYFIYASSPKEAVNNLKKQLNVL